MPWQRQKPPLDWSGIRLAEALGHASAALQNIWATAKTDGVF